MVRQRLISIMLGSALLVALLISLSEYRTLRHSIDLDPITGLQTLHRQQPWGGFASQALANRLEARWRLDPEAAQAGLNTHLRHYPLDPWRWLLLARIDRELGADHARSQQRLNAALAVQPGHRELRWRAVNLTQHFGDAELVAEHLKRWLDSQPQLTASALFIARRWIDDPNQQLERILPHGEAYLVQAMRHARSTRDTPLADAVWQRLPQPRSVNDPAVGDYARLLLSRGDHDVADDLLRQLDPHFAISGVPGGQFQFDLDGLSTLGWDFRSPAGLRIRITHHDLPPFMISPTAHRPGALQLDFDGEHNLNFTRPALRFPAPPPGRYQLVGWWRAQSLTTRSLPSLQLRAQYSVLREQLPLPTRNFGWQQFALEFDITADRDTLSLEIVRRSTQAFDRNLAGQLMLTDLRLEPVATATETQL